MTGSLRFFLRTIPLLDFGLWTKLMGEGSGLRIWFPNFGWDLFSNEHLWDTLCSFWSLIPESCVWTIVWVLERVWRGWAWLLPDNVTQLAFSFLFIVFVFCTPLYFMFWSILSVTHQIWSFSWTLCQNLWFGWTLCPQELSCEVWAFCLSFCLRSPSRGWSEAGKWLSHLILPNCLSHRHHSHQSNLIKHFMCSSPAPWCKKEKNPERPSLCQIDKHTPISVETKVLLLSLNYKKYSLWKRAIKWQGTPSSWASRQKYSTIKLKKKALCQRVQ